MTRTSDLQNKMAYLLRLFESGCQQTGRLPYCLASHRSRQALYFSTPPSHMADIRGPVIILSSARRGVSALSSRVEPQTSSGSPDGDKGKACTRTLSIYI